MKKFIYIFLIIFSFSYCEYIGVGISQYSGRIDWATLSQNVDFVMLSCLNLLGGFNQKFENSYINAKNYGIQVGALWSSNVNKKEDVAREAKYCLEFIKEKQFEYPIFFSSLFDNGELLDTFCTVLEKAGYYCGLYIDDYSLSYYDENILNKYTVWLSRDTFEEPSVPHSIWQTSLKKYPGIDGIVDISNTDFGTFMKENHLNGF